MADPAEGSAAETVAGSAPAAPAPTGDAAHGTPSDGSTAPESNASPDASVAPVEDGQDAAERLSRKERREQARARNGQFAASEQAADETAETVADTPVETPAPPPTFTAEDIAREARRLRDEEKAQEAAAAKAAKAAEEAAEAERQSMAAIAALVGFAPGKKNQQATQYDELIQAVTDRDWDTLDQYGVSYGDLDAALDLKASLDVQRKAWSEATTVADKRAWRHIDSQHEAIANLPGVDPDKFKAATKGPNALLDSVTVAVQTAVGAKDAEWQVKYDKTVDDFRGQVATLEAKLEAATTQAASRMPAPDGGGRAWTGGQLTAADYAAMTTAQRIALRSTPEGRAQIDQMTRARLAS